MIEAGFTSFGDIEDLTKEEILDKKIFEYLFSIEDISNREKIIMKLEEKARKINALPNFKRVFKQYEKKYSKIEKQSSIGNKVTHNEIAKNLLENNSIVIYENDLYIYENGFYIKDKRSIEQKILNLVPDATSYFREEVYKNLNLEAKSMTLDRESGVINFKNGLFDIKTKKLCEHTSNFFSINQINTNYNPNAEKVQAVDDVLNKLSSGKLKRKQTILEMIGYSMTTSVKLQKAFILYGETARNGKSTLTDIITELFGRENVGNVSFKEMNKNRFAASGIKGKILDMGKEMTTEYIDDVSIFKMFITGDYLEIEEKFKPKQSIRPYAKFIFNANKLPAVADKTNGFYRRLQIIPLETSFTNKDANSFDFNKIVSKEALEYLAKISVEAYMNMGETFSNYEESEQEVSKYKIEANSILSFINDEDYIMSIIEKNKVRYANDIYVSYKQYCIENEYRPIGRNKFYKEFERSKLISIIGQYNHQKTYTFNLDFYNKS